MPGGAYIYICNTLFAGRRNLNVGMLHAYMLASLHAYTLTCMCVHVCTLMCSVSYSRKRGS